MEQLLKQGALDYKLSMTTEALNGFEIYYAFLEEISKVMNLTSIKGRKDVAQMHFLDSLEILTLDAFAGKSVIDIGSGAGFPGIPMKLCELGLSLTLLDAQQKRVDFMEELCRRLQLTDVQCLHARAEEASRLPNLRDQYDCAVSRAVASLNILSEICLPFVKCGGTFIAMKGIDSDEEIKASENAVEKLGASVEKVVEYKIPGTDVCHRAVVIRKLEPTPEGYPRRFAKIQKHPL